MKFEDEFNELLVSTEKAYRDLTRFRGNLHRYVDSSIAGEGKWFTGSLESLEGFLCLAEDFIGKIDDQDIMCFRCGDNYREDCECSDDEDPRQTPAERNPNMLKKGA